MKTSAQIKDSIDVLRDELDAIIAVSERETRDLSDDESTRCSAISEKEIPALTKQLATASAIEEDRRQRVIARAGNRIADQQRQGVIGNDDAPIGSIGSFSIPARAKAHGKLTAFDGPDSERDAYISGQAVLAGVFGNAKASQWCADRGLVVRASMTEGTNSAGGFLVPDEMSSALIRLREARGVFPQYANRVPMGSDIISIPRLLSDCTAYWVGEGVEITASDAALGMAELMARKLGALCKVSTELDEDAVISIGDMVTTSMAYAMADKVDEAGFNGDGTSTYGGVLGLKNALDSAAITTAATGNDAANNLDLADFEAVVGSYPEYPGASPRWFMSKPVYWASAGRLVDAGGGNNNVTLGAGPSETMFLGYPVTYVQVMNKTVTTLASTIQAYFGDLRLGASYGVRRSPQTMVSTERYFELDMIGIKMTERIAINVHERGADIRTRPIVALKTAA